MTIDNFSGPWRFLSNFYPAPVEFEGDIYPTTEHAYQAAKTKHLDLRQQIRFAATPGEAKRLGRRLLLRPDWEKIKVSVMRYLIRQKFAPKTSLGLALLGTSGQELIEGNTWGDTFWGVCNGVGENWLGRLLMEERGVLCFSFRSW